MSEHDDFAASIGATPVEESHDDFAASIGATPVSDNPAPAPAPDREISKLESLGRGIQQGGTLGFGDEFSGAVDAALHLGSKVLPYDSGYKDVSEAYHTGRDANREENHAAQKANPKSYFAGELGGGVATSFLPGAGILNAGKGDALATVLGKNAIQGGITGLGASESDTLGGNALGAVKGAGISGGMGLLGSAVGKLTSGAAARADLSASKAAEDAVGLTRTLGQRKRLMDEIEGGAVDEGEIGKFLRDRKVFSPTDSAHAVVSKIKSEKDKVGDAIGEIIKEGKPVSVQAIADKIRSKMKAYENSGVSNATKNELESTASAYEKIGQGAGDDLEKTIPLEQVRRDKSTVGEQVKDFLSTAASKRAGRDIYGSLADTIEENVDPSKLDALRASNRDYSLLKHVDDAAKGRAAQLDGKSALGLGNTLPATLGALFGGPKGAIAGAAAGQVKAQRGPQLRMGAYDLLSKILGKMPETSNLGGAVSTPTVLNTQNGQDGDEQYRKLMELLGGGK